MNSIRCRDTFIFLIEISTEKLSNLKKWYLEHGLMTRKKLSAGWQKTAQSIDDIRNVTRFISNSAEVHSLSLLGIFRIDMWILPSFEIKASAWRLYQTVAWTNPTTRCVAYSSFKKLWAQLLPYAVIGKPASDSCWICQKNNNFVWGLHWWCIHSGTTMNGYCVSLDIQTRRLVRINNFLLIANVQILWHFCCLHSVFTECCFMTVQKEHRKRRTKSSPLY